MVALALTLVTLLFVLVLGLGLTAALRRGPLGTFDVLLAPATGFAVVCALATPLSWVGVPVNRFAAGLVSVLALAALAALITQWARILPALRRSLPFAPICVLAFGLVGAPMLTFGLNWLSYANDDGINYALSAERLRVEGLYTVPNKTQLVGDRNIVADFFYLNGIQPERYGAEEMLAVFSSTVHLESLRALMPMEIAIHLAALLAAAALVYRSRNGRRAALVVAIALACAALFAFGTLEQLLAQSFGLMYLSAAVARTCDPRLLETRGWDRAGAIALCALLFVALAEAYPEALPFAVLTVLAFHFARRPDRVRDRSTLLAGTAVLGVAWLAFYMRNILFVLLGRLDRSNQAAASTFPYFMVPSGPPNLFGLFGIELFPPEPLLSAAILGGLLLLALLVGLAVAEVRKAEPVAYLMLVYCVLAIVLFRENEGFSLFKLAMYVQAALWCVFALGFVRVMSSRRPGTRAAASVIAVLLVGANIATQQNYVAASRSTREVVGRFVEVPDASGGPLLDELGALRRGIPQRGAVVSDAIDQTLSKIEGFYARDRTSLLFPTADMLPLTGYNAEHATRPFYSHRFDRVARALSDARQVNFRRETFRTQGGPKAVFTLDERLTGDIGQYWLNGSDEGVFNRSGLRESHDVNAASPARLHGALVFVESTIGLPNFGHRDPIAVFPLESDYFAKGDSMEAFGRYVLFEVLGAQSPLRIQLALTETLRGDGDERVPPVSVVGTQRVGFSAVGRGSADLVSDPVVPRRIGGRSFVLLDLGEAPAQLPFPRHGLMLLWGRGLALDNRRVAAFVRNVSVVDPRRQGPVTSRITHFPADLLSPRARYSGIYEDGWGSDDMAVTLDAGTRGEVHLRGVVPNIGDQTFYTNVQTFVDGFPVETNRLSVGDVDVAVFAGPGVHRIEWRFSRFQRLPNGDHRPVSLQLSSIESAG
jgi:hypothetical protein